MKKNNSKSETKKMLIDFFGDRTRMSEDEFPSKKTFSIDSSILVLLAKRGDGYTSRYLSIFSKTR